MIRRLAAVASALAMWLSGVASTAAAPADIAPRRADLEALTSDDDGRRFRTAMRLVRAPEPDVDRLLSAAGDDGLFRGSAMGAAAAEFVRLKRSGKSLLGRPPPPDAGPSFLLISIDTLRADHLSCYGYGRMTTPAIDELAKRGVLFETAISPSSWTLPVHMSILTSLYPSFHKIDRAGRLGSIRLDDSAATVVEILKAAGYATAGFAAHGYLDPVWGFNRGFDFYQTYVSQADEQTERLLLWLEWHSFHVARGLVAPPFFLFAHFLDPHGTGSNRLFLEPDVPETGLRHRVAIYDGQIRLVDDNLGRVFDALRDSGWGESTVIVVTSDHGEEFEEHGGRGHKSTLYDELLKVPLILAYPRAVAAGQRVRTPVSLLDIAPTMLQLAGKVPPPAFQGVSLTAYLDVKTAGPPRHPPAPRELFAELHPLDFTAGYDHFRRAVRGSRYKLIRTSFKNGRTTNELYDLIDDPREQRNLYDARTTDAPVQALEAKLSAFVRRGAAHQTRAPSEGRIELSPDLLERLRALGYAD